MPKTAEVFFPGRIPLLSLNQQRKSIKLPMLLPLQLLLLFVFVKLAYLSGNFSGLGQKLMSLKI